MKTVILAACLLATVGSFAAPKENFTTYSVKKSGDGQHIPASEVPAPVKRDKNARYPNATNTQWELESEHGMQVYQAQFRKANGQRTKAQWFADGTFLGER
jgi:hypothetical protein